MAGSNRNKTIKVGKTPPQKVIKIGGNPKEYIRTGANPDSIMQEHPVWRLADCDVDESGIWSFYKERLKDVFWDVIFPSLRQFESMTWSDIFIKGKKSNHGIDPNELNKCARERLIELRVEAEAIHSLRLGGKIRLYGYMTGAVYNILWYDDDHGDNSTCVCRSALKHT